MNYYPPGAFEMLIAIDNERARRDEMYKTARAARSEELREAAKTSAMIEYHNGVRYQLSPSVKIVAEDIPNELIEQMMRAWMIGDMELMARNAYAACEIAFEKAVDFIATCDAEFSA